MWRDEDEGVARFCEKSEKVWPLLLPHRQLQYQRVVDFVNTVLQGIQPVTEMKAGYTGVDIDLHRIHSRDDMDKCKIYSLVDRGGRRGSVRIYSGEKA